MQSITILVASLATIFMNSSGLVATDVIKVGDPITTENAETTGAVTQSEAASLFGREVKRTVYKGQEISLNNTRAPRLIKRNQVVTIKYVNGSLEIVMTGRALSDAGLNDPITAMNIGSKQIINGVVQKDGWILVE